MRPSKVNIIDAVDSQIADVFDPYIVGDVNDAQVKIAKFGEAFEWHTHAEEDEGFLVLRGRIALDFRDGTVELAEGDFIVVPRTVEHRPRSLTDEPVVLMFEPSTTLNTGDAVTDLTVSQPKRLRSGAP
ncbi:MAG: cupin domain-containing protein [Alphaproteobacteria bacterium]|nr:cupin domain-containing protein [Alphaproteobacteria bacterium]